MNYKISKSISLLGLLISSLGCFTSSYATSSHRQDGDFAPLKEHMQAFIKKEMAEKDIVGLSVALVDDQKIVWKEGFGYADQKKKIKATPTTKYRAGSITKLFNAMAVMKLVEFEKMDIDKPLVTYLPEFSIKSRFGKTDGITARLIMAHHSGLPGDWLDKFYSKNPMPYTQYVKEIKDEYVSYPPNKIFSYSNLAVTLLGHSVEKVSGEAYVDFLKRVLLEPLKMKESDFKAQLQGENASKGYSEGKERLEYPIGMVPAGALNTTVIDLSQLAMMINAKGKIGDKNILKYETLKKMFQVQNQYNTLDLEQKIGLGYFIEDQLLEGESVYLHGGATSRHRASFMVAPKSKLGVVVLCNSDLSDPGKIAKELLQKAWEIKTTKKLKHKKESHSVLSDFTGIYATIFGKVEIVKKSETHYVAHTANGKVRLKYRDGRFYPKYLLFGFIPIGDTQLDDFGLMTVDIEGEHLIIHDKDIVGARVKAHPISLAWKKRLGKYRLVNQIEPKNMQIKELTLKLEEEYLFYEISMESGEKSSLILRVINDTEAMIEGVGRGAKESVRIEGDTITYAGLRFEPMF